MAAAVALAWVSVTAAACSSDADPDVTGPGTPATSSDTSSPTPTTPVINQSEDPEYGMDSWLIGRLRLEDDCLTIGRHPVLWPTHARWHAQDQTVRSTQSKVTLHVGDRVRLGGGGVWVRDLGSFTAPQAYAQLSVCASRTDRAKVYVVTRLFGGGS